MADIASIVSTTKSRLEGASLTLSQRSDKTLVGIRQGVALEETVEPALGHSCCPLRALRQSKNRERGRCIAPKEHGNSPGFHGNVLFPSNPVGQHAARNSRSHRVGK